MKENTQIRFRVGRSYYSGVYTGSFDDDGGGYSVRCRDGERKWCLKRQVVEIIPPCDLCGAEMGEDIRGKLCFSCETRPGLDWDEAMFEAMAEVQA